MAIVIRMGVSDSDIIPCFARYSCGLGGDGSYSVSNSYKHGADVVRVTRLADPSKCLIQTGCRCCVEFISHMASEALKGVATQQLDEM
jgi:hypothetical protein